MYFKSKTITLIILLVTAVICSRILLTSFNDPEGPNLLIVGVLSLVVYALSLSVYLEKSITGLKKLLLGVLAQVVIVTVLYFLFR